MKKALLVSFLIVLAAVSFGVVTYDLQKVIIVPEKPQGTLEVTIWLDRDNGSLYYSGEEVKTYFKVNKDAYVAIYDITPNGEIQLIFPNGYDRDNFVRANRNYTLPTDSATTRYRLQLTSETGGGKEIFQIVASTQPLGFLDDLLKKVQSGDVFPKASSSADDFVVSKVIPVIDKQEYAVSTAWFYLDIMPNKGYARITTTPSGAILYVDGKNIGTSPITLELDEGNHIVTAYRDGYRTETRQFTISAGRTVDIKIDLQKLVSNYQLSIATNPSSADVYIDNRYVGRSPLNLTLEEGTKNLRIERSGYETYYETFVLDRSLSKNISLKKIAASYQLSLITNPSGADVYIDNTYMGRSPLNLTLEEGTKNLRIDRSGYETYYETFVLDRSLSKNITLKPIVVNYQLSLITNPSSADVYIDNTYMGRSPLNLTLPEGTKNLRIEKSGYETYYETLLLNRSISKSITLSPQIKTYKLSVSSSPSNARVYINGTYEGMTPIALTLKEGTYTVQLTLDGYEDFVTSVNLDRDRQVTATLYSKKARLSIETDPSNATIYVDNSYVGRSPITIDLDAGRHTVKIEKAGYLTETRDVNLSAGTTSSLKVVMQEEKPVARINITSDPKNARIFINGKDYGRTDRTVELEPGYYEIIIVLEGYRVSITYRYFGKGDHNLSFNLTKID
jgi:hypothetical protein